MTNLTFRTHANMKGLGLTPLFGDRRGFMPPQVKTTNKLISDLKSFSLKWQFMSTSIRKKEAKC